jgi:hypothetical protein
VNRQSFSRKQTLDLQTAMARALARTLGAAVFPGPGNQGEVRFRQVYEEWPGPNDRHATPAACVRSDQRITYADAMPTPQLLEDTWEPQGRSGLGLYKSAEGECDFQVEVRCASKPERSAVSAGVEELFLPPGVLQNHAAGPRYGVLVPMPEYWGLSVRLSVQSRDPADDAEAAIKNRWEARFLVRAQAPKVRLDVVQPFRLKIVELIDGEPA